MPPDAPRPGPYRHHKGGMYVVLCAARHSETEEWMVVYRAVRDGTVWVRPLAMWTEHVRHGNSVVPRFAPVAEGTLSLGREAGSPAG